LACSSLNTLYQFWIHTRLIGKLGPLEWVLNTPSHHRVHHGCDPKYIDKNYGGTTIVWDRLFGTFQEEEEEPTYGITKPLASWNPLWANVHYYADLYRAGKEAPSFKEKLRLWLAPPAKKPAWATGGMGDAHGRTPLVDGEAGKFDARAPRGMGGYLLGQFVIAVLLTVALLYLGPEMTLAERLGMALLVAWTVTNVGASFERRRWVTVSELLRLAVLWGAVVVAVTRLEPTAAAAVAVGWALLSGLCASWLLHFRRALLADGASGAPAAAS
jgi:hypothetical protein